MSPSTVHPRLRGEHISAWKKRSGLTGSSPPARGTHRTYLVGAGLARFIPACAGNTNMNSARPSWRPVHPRLRGEHAGRYQEFLFVLGSSPPARGTRYRYVRDYASRRFIPACAGNTSAQQEQHHSATVHPRLRGEHAYWRSITEDPGGSSPPARGTRRARHVRRRRRRFIPACAGNTRPAGQ